MWETQSQEFYDSEDDLDERVNSTHTHLARLITDFVLLPEKLLQSLMNNIVGVSTPFHSMIVEIMSKT